MKLGIKDPTVRIKPSKEFLKLIRTKLNDEQCVPKNILVIQSRAGVKEFTQEIPSPKFTKDELAIIKEVMPKANPVVNDSNVEGNVETEQLDSDERVEEERDEEQDESGPQEIKGPLLDLNDIKWISQILNARREKGEDLPYIHQLIENSEVILPQNEYIKRNPELEARCQQLRKEQEQRQYDQMTKNVDNTQRFRPDDTIGYQMKQINKQLVAVLQFIVSVAAGFAFGFIGIDLLVERTLDFGFRLLLGIMFALTIALAEIYFLAKKLNEDYVEPVKKSPEKTSTDYAKEKKEN